MPAGLQRLDQPELILRKDAGIDCKIVRGDSIGNGPRRTHRPLESNSRRDAWAVGAASPVTMTVRTPIEPSLATCSGVPSRRIAEGDQTEQRRCWGGPAATASTR